MLGLSEALLAFFLDEVEELEKVRTRRADDLRDARPGLFVDRFWPLVLAGDPLAAFSCSSSALALMYFFNQSRTPRKFL